MSTSKLCIPTFRNLIIGNYKCTDDLVKALKNEHIYFGDYVIEMLKITELSKQERMLSLVVLSVNQLGYVKAQGLSKILETAEGFGLKRCPSEVGPQLLLQLGYLPFDVDITVAMTPIEIGGNLGLYNIQDVASLHWGIRGKHLWRQMCGEGFVFSPDDQFVFVEDDRPYKE